MTDTQDTAAQDTAPSETPPEGIQPAPPADFGPLLQEARAVDGERVHGHDGQPMTEAAELQSALELARAMVRPMFDWWPDFATVWNDKAISGIASTGAQVMQRHGLSLGGLLGQYGPYIGLAMATVPPSYVTYKAIQAQKAKLQYEAAQENQKRAGHGSHEQAQN